MKPVVVNTTRANLTNLPFGAIKNRVLGKTYDLTVVITNSEHMKKLNGQYRNKKNSTDILSFPLSETTGEIYLCPSQARLEAKKFDMSYENFLKYLFIHGCAHLKGYDHSDTMEVFEKNLRKFFIR